MAETQEKRADDSTSGNTKNTDANNQTGGSAQNNTQSNTGGTTNSSNKQGANSSSNTSGSTLPDPKEILQQAKETAGQAYDKVTEQASSQIVTQKDNLAQGLSSVADSIRQMGENLRSGEQKTPIADFTAKYSDSLAQQVEQVSNYLEKKDLGELVRDIEVFARRNPAVFIGSAFALGLVAARFLKSGNPNQALMRRPRRNRKGVYIPDESEGVYLPEDLSRKVGLTDTVKTSNTSTSGTSQRSESGTSSIGDRTAGSGSLSVTDSKIGAGDFSNSGSGSSNSNTTDRASSDFSTNKGG